VSTRMVQESDFGVYSRRALNAPADDRPGWVQALQQLYKPVVDEPLFGSFADIVARLDRMSAVTPGI